MRYDGNIIFCSAFLGITLLLTVMISITSRVYLKCMLKRFIRTQFRKRLLDSQIRPAENDSFTSYYQTSLGHLQKANNELLGKILQKNYNCSFFTDRSISFLFTHRPPSATSDQFGYCSVDEFRERVPLTTFDDYRPYIDRMVYNGEKHLLSSSNMIYLATSSGTTGTIKLVPIIKDTIENPSKLPNSL